MNEIQYINSTGNTGGQFQLCFNGIAIAPVAWNISASSLQTALEASCGIGNAQVTGSQSDGYTIKFIGTLANIPLPLIHAVGVTGCGSISASRVMAGTGATAWYDPLNDSTLKGIWYPGFGMMDYAQANFITSNSASVYCWLSAANSGAKWAKSSGVPVYNSAGGSLTFASTQVLNASITGFPVTAGAARTTYVRFDPNSQTGPQFPMSFGGTAAGTYGSGKLTTWQLRYDATAAGSPSKKWLGVDCNWDGWGWDTVGGLSSGSYHHHLVSYPLNGAHGANANGSDTTLKFYYAGAVKSPTKSYNFSSVTASGRLDTDQSAGPWCYIGNLNANSFGGKIAAVAVLTSQVSDADALSLSTTPSVPASAANPLVIPGRLPSMFHNSD